MMHTLLPVAAIIAVILIGIGFALRVRQWLRDGDGRAE